jgi:hypothetical protein
MQLKYFSTSIFRIEFGPGNCPIAVHKGYKPPTQLIDKYIFKASVVEPYYMQGPNPTEPASQLH